MDHRQRRQWQPLISFTIGVVSLFAFLFLILFIWKIVMPASTTDMQIPGLNNEEITISEQLQKRVTHLSDSIGQRNLFTPGSMEQTAQWLLQQLENAGYSPEVHTYTVQTIAQVRETESKNIIVDLPGTANPGSIIVIGAHYDSVYGSPGANDNASGVAVLLSLAEYFSNKPQPKTVRFVFFANEEPPFFKTRNMGSLAYARTLEQTSEQVKAMIALDGLGTFSDEKGSQKYPVPGIGLVYPKTANFIGMVTRFSDLNLLRTVTTAFREQATIPSEAAALPSFVPGASWSDHWAFWQIDVPSVLFTDTLPFRDDAYHTMHDTPERLDYDRMSRVAFGLRNVVKKLAD